MLPRTNLLPVLLSLVVTTGCGGVSTADTGGPEDSGSSDAATFPDVTLDARDATDGSAPARQDGSTSDGSEDASLDGTAPDVFEAAPPPACVVDPNAPGTAYWALQSGGPAPMNDGQGDYVPAGMAVDRDGNLVVAGSFYGVMQLGDITLSGAPYVDPDSPNPPESQTSSYDVFVAKFDPSGKVLFAKSFGDGGAQMGEAVAVDASGNIFLTGEYSSTISFGGVTATLDTGVGAQPGSGGPFKMFLVKLDPQGNGIFSRGFGQADTVAHGAHGTAIAVDPSGDVFVTGFFAGSIDFTGGTAGTGTFTSVGVYNPSEQGFWQPGGDGVLAKFTNAGDFVFAKSFGTSGSTQDPSRLVTGSDGSIFVAGALQGSLDPSGQAGAGPNVLTSPTVCGAGAAQPITAFLAKLDASGNSLWGQTFLADGHTLTNSLASDPAGGLLMTGSFSGSSDILDAGYATDAALPGPDAAFACVTALDYRPWTNFLTRLDGDGGRLWTQVVGSPLQAATGSTPIATDLEGGVYVGGTNKTDLQGGAPQYLATLSKFDAQGRFVWIRVMGTSGGSFFISMASDPCAAQLFAGGVLGSYPDGSTMSFQGVDGVSIDVGAQGTGYAPPIDMWLARLAP